MSKLTIRELSTQLNEKFRRIQYWRDQLRHANLISLSEGRGIMDRFNRSEVLIFEQLRVHVVLEGKTVSEGIKAIQAKEKLPIVVDQQLELEQRVHELEQKVGVLYKPPWWARCFAWWSKPTKQWLQEHSS